MKRVILVLLALTTVAGAARAQSGAVRPVNPPQLPANPAFTQAMVVSGPHRTIYVGGQNAVDADGRILAEGDVGAQTVQALRNLETVLHAAGAELRHVVKWQILVVEGASLQAGFAAFQQVWGDRGPPPTLTVAVVRALWHPAVLVEIDAVAVVSDTP